MSHDLKTIIFFSIMLSLLSLVFAGVAPSVYTLGFSAFFTAASVVFLTYSVLKDEE